LDGILDFVTKKGDLSAVDLGKSGYRVEYELPGVADTFYSPDYSGKEMLYNHIPDFRNTLYWNPSMLTDKKGNARAEFFSSDDAGEYTVIVEGMTADGRRGSARISLKID
jgi:uncharacterized protein YfaS (alpha-2-macroglobulin family)